MKTNLDSIFKLDDKAIEDGIDFFLGDIVFKIRYFNPRSHRVKAAMAKYYKPHARQVELGTLPAEKEREIQINLFLDICLVKWDGLVDDKMAPIPYSRENALKVFDRLPELFDTLWRYANDFSSFKEQEVGNSSHATSSGPGSGEKN